MTILSGIVLAAGEGRRMGSTKALLEVRGSTLVEHHVARLVAWTRRQTCERSVPEADEPRPCESAASTESTVGPDELLRFTLGEGTRVR